MIPAIIPNNEEERLKTLREYEILDTLPEQQFDDLTTIASEICGTSISLVSLVDRDRQWFKAKVGLDAAETHRDLAFCAHAILEEQVFVVEDASKDERFHDNPLVTQLPDIRFYAGAPLKAHNGMALGTLCVIDQQPKVLTTEQKLALEALARQVEALFELRRQNANVIQAQKEISQKNVELLINSKHQTRFMNHVSHEIRTPLNAILGFSDILAQRMPVHPNMAEDSDENLIQYINTAALGLADIVNHVLDISRIEAGKMQLDLKDVFAEDLLKEVSLINQNRAQKKDVNLSYEIADDVPKVLSLDRVKVIQILVNLVGNAVKFTPPDKSVLIKLYKAGEQLVFEVKDEGIGISDEQMNCIFEPFKQIDNDFTDQYVGSGLGLTICKELTEFLGGELTCVSRLNVGSVFSVSIPYCQGKLANVMQTTLNLDLDLSDLNLLLVEDNPVNQIVLKSYLKDSGANIEVVADAKSALKYLHTNMPDLMLLDLGLPDMNGFELMERLDETIARDLKVIIISGDVTEESLSKAKTLGIEHFLRKPIRKNVVVKTIGKVLNK